MVKLSQQFDQKQPSLSERPTRTQRVAVKQQEQTERKEFESLKARANVKQQQLSGLTIDQYEKEYNLLDPKLKRFFSTPATLRIEKTERIDATKQTIKERLAFADKKLLEEKLKFDKDMARARERYNRDKKRNRDKARERLDKREHKLEDEFDEDEAKWKGYKEGLQKGSRELNKNKDVTFESIDDFAWDVARFEEDKEEARNNKKEFDRKQRDEIKRLEEQGFQPQIIEKSFKGQPKSVELTFFNPITKKWKKVADFDVKAPVDVSGLKRVGFSQPQTRTVEFGGKSFSFQSRIGVFKEKSGQIVTPFQKTGVTEQDLIKQSQQKAFEEFKASSKDKVIVPLRIIPQQDLPIGFGGQQTVSTEPINQVISEKRFFEIKDKPKDFGFIGEGAGFVFKKAKEGFSFVDERFHFTGDIKKPLAFGKLDKPTDPELASQLAIKFLSKISDDIETKAIGEEKIKTFKTGLETKFDQQFQTAFEQKHMEDLIFEKTTFEEASKEFSGSEEAKLIQRRYQEEFETGFKDLQTSPSQIDKIIAGSKRAGLSLTSLGITAVSTPSKTALATATVLTGVKTLKAIPSGLNLALTGGLFTFGSIRALDKSSTIDVAGSGFVTAVLSGVTLGFAGFKHLRSPVIKTVKIPAPKIDLKASEIIGRNVKLITDKGVVKKIIFSNQKLSQIGTAGRRTIVTTKGREILRKAQIHIGIPPKLADNVIFKGVPKAQPKIKSFGFSPEPSGHQKALTLLTKSGYTKAQANRILRFTAPRVTEQFLKQGVLSVKGAKATGRFEFVTKRAVIDVDKTLGIKTRGGGEIKDIIDVKRILGKIDDSNVVFEGRRRLAFKLTRGKAVDLKAFELSSGFSVGKTSDLTKGLISQQDDLGEVISKINFRDLTRISVEGKLFPKVSKVKIVRSDTKLIEQIIDLRSPKGLTPAKIKKTPFSVTFGKDNLVDDILKKINKPIKAPRQVSSINQVINKLDDVGARAESQFAGKGQFELTSGGLSPQALSPQAQLQTQLFTAPQPPALKGIVGLKDLILLKDVKVAQLSLATLTGIKTATAIKTDFKFKTDFKVGVDVKALLKDDLGIKVAQLPALKTTPALKTQLKTILDLDLGAGITSPPTPTFRPPKIPIIDTPLPPIPLAILLLGKSKARKKKKGLKGIQEFAFLPDFTSRALGLEAVTLTQKQAQRQLKKLLTGLEIRRAVKIK